MAISTFNQLPSLGDFDAIVVGSGSAGSIAAIAAGRSGARTLLIERYGFLGGTSTAVLDTFYGFYTPGKQSIKVVGGVPDDVVAGLHSYKMVFERPNTYGAGTGVTYHPEYLKVVWDTLVRGAGVSVLLHAWVQAVETDGKGTITRLIVATKMGLQEVRARLFIDCSGEADVCHYAGIPYELAGDIEPAQTLTTTFRMVNVDAAKRKTVKKQQLHDLMADAAASGKYDLPRREGSDHAMPVDGMTATVMTRVQSFAKREGKTINATDPQLLTEAEITGRRQAIEYARFLKDRVPGYERAELAALGVQIGIRETRRVQGEYRLTREDVLTAKQFDDQIGLCGAPIEDHHGGADTAWHYLPEGKCVGIPYRTLIPQQSNNALVAGRCFSATHDAHASVRSMAQCMAMGQAAGTAVGMAIKQGEMPREINAADLRDKLRATGAILELASG